MKRFSVGDIPEYVLGIIMFGLIIIGLCGAIYDIMNTTYEIVPKTGTVISKRTETIEEPKYKTIDGERRLVGYTTRIEYYLICAVENDTTNIEVNMVDYYSYSEGYSIALNKIYAYKKGTNELKCIVYEQKRD